MGELARFFSKLSPNSLGEALRDITFGRNFCVIINNIRLDAIPWSQKQIKVFYKEYFSSANNEDMVHAINRNTVFGYTFIEGSMTIDVFWYYISDGTLCFRVKEGEEIIALIVTADCEETDQWENLERLEA